MILVTLHLGLSFVYFSFANKMHRALQRQMYPDYICIVPSDE